MDWLKDKKNQPIIAVVAAVIIMGVLIFVIRPMIFGGGSSGDQASAPPEMGTPPPSEPAAQVPEAALPSDTGAAPPAGTAQASTSSTPMEPWRADPFLPVGYKAPVKARVRKLPISDFPFLRISIPPKDVEQIQVQDAVQPARRMAGLLLNKRVYAIIDTSGVSEIVQPGDRLKDGLAVVEKIEQDKVILKTTDKKPKYIVVRMAASPRTDLGTAAGAPGNSAAGAARPTGLSGPMMSGMRGSRPRNRM
ncbi:MAG: hypothetical protein ABFD49_07910 [Armatimonadota bacterium]|nr:hypothetical protein [bacterium]